MLTSSREYLQALREGNFLLFLEWPQFITQHYSKEKKTIDADTTLKLIIIEWSKNGFCLDDVKQMALLTKASELNSALLRSNLSYAFISLSIAMFQCMTLQADESSDSTSSSSSEEPVAESKRIASEQEANAHALFASIQESIDDKLAIQTFKRIYSIAQYRYLADEYTLVLENIRNHEDELLPSRLSLVKRLASYLNEQMEYTEQVKDEMGLYIKQIWDMQPTYFEKYYLNAIYRLSIVDNAWKLVTDYGLTFFRILQPSSSPRLECTSETQENNLCN